MKRLLGMLGAVLLVVSLGLLFGMTQTAAQSDNGQSEIQRGLSIAPVTLTIDGNKRGLVGLGSYYVNGVSDCVGCHSGASGHLGGGNVFGPVVSRNLTPNAAGLPAGLTFDEFKQVIQFGTDFKNLPPPGSNTLIVMPWPEYKIATDRWIEAVYEYLKAIPCIEGGPGNTVPRC
jgi:hypothetical protein